LTAGENKGFLDPFSPQTEKQRAFAQTMLDQIHQQFIAVVKAGRGDRLKSTPDTFSGLFWTGQQAIDWAWPTTWAAWTRWRARWSRPRTSSTTRAARTWPSAWPSALAHALGAGAVQAPCVLGCRSCAEGRPFQGQCAMNWLE
jgi:hypothetical protein